MNTLNMAKMTASANHTETAAKYCPYCQGRMELAVGEYPVGEAFDLNWFHVDVYYCPKCNKKSLGGALFG